MKEKVTGLDSNKNYRELNVSDLSFRPSVYGILIEDKKILLSKQWDGYDFPGGGMNIDETIEETLVREFWEETGIKVKMDRLVACENVFYHSIMRNESWNWLGIYYLCHKNGGDLSIQNVDDEERKYLSMPEWIELTSVEKLKFYNNVDSLKLINTAKDLIYKL